MYRNNDIMEKELNEIGAKLWIIGNLYSWICLSQLQLSVVGQTESGRGKRRVYGCTWIHGKGTAGNKATKMVYDEDYANLVSILENVVRTHDNGKMQLRIVRPDGKTRWVEMRCSVLAHYDVKPYVVLFLWDIDEEKDGRTSETVEPEI